MSDSVHIEATEQTNPKITIYRAKDAKQSMDAMEFAPLDEIQMQGLSRGAEAGSDDGAVVKVLFSSETVGVSLTYAWFKKGLPLPRHSHNADCLYYVISGQLQYGRETLEAGDGMLVPAGALYTFESVGENGVEFVEFRKATKYDIKLNTPAKVWDRQCEQTIAHRDAWKLAKPPLAAQRMLDGE